MNFRLRGGFSVMLMSRRHNAPYPDRVEEDGRVIIYEGHDAPRTRLNTDPKKIDQPELNPSGSLTQNGLFYRAASQHRIGEAKPELVRVYEKIMDGVWAYNGVFRLVDAWREQHHGRRVFKFRLEVTDESSESGRSVALEHRRVIPSAIKAEVWRRDHGRCVICGRIDNLHFDHIIPYSKGGSSMLASNIQLLCARHN
ncbi:MAG: HNH endonuclease, partial [Calditrichaeota bacterium]|nr:HNH endonuclease [Calditrichota bacterium]